MKHINTLPDEQLVELYIQGNNTAFDILLRRYESRVFSYLMSTLRNQEQAEDFFQDIFIKIVVRLKNRQYEETGKFASWIMRIAHNHLVDHYRTSLEGIIVSDEENGLDLQNSIFISSDATREKEIIDQQTLSEVKELIKLLPDAQREVLKMRVYEELSFKEIAKKTNCSINTALGRMRYAILNLRQLANKYGVEIA
ncbi:MAG: sigma-70 family RNA polymerase sigma factor [Bacteroidaceae bacterium]|nr:sigma-70 family RNA polymerase sigma factor [Bacteroidaceae bacterium]